MRYFTLLFALIIFYTADAKLFPVFDGDYVSYIDSTGEVKIRGEYYPLFDKSKMTINGKDLANITFRDNAFFSDGLAFVRHPYRFFGLFTVWNDYYFIDESGKVILEVNEPDFSSFSKGYSRFLIQQSPTQYGLIDTAGKRVYVKDTIDTKKGRVEILFSRLYFVTGFHDGKALALSADTDGTPYTYIKEVDKELVVCKERFEEADVYSEGLAGVKIDGKWGFMNEDFRVQISPQFDFVNPFHNGFAKVMIGKFFGFINKKGKMVIDAKYEKTGEINGGYVNVLSGGLWGLLDSNGNWKIRPKYTSLGDFKNGLMAFESDGQYGYLDENNKVIIPAEYDYVEDFDSGLAKVWKDKELYYIDTSGKRIWTILDADDHNSVLENVKRKS